jgi:hypothetical protein
MGCQCDWETIERAETIILVVVQAAPPAARKRADAAYMAVFFGLFKAGVFRTWIGPHSK